VLKCRCYGGLRSVNLHPEDRDLYIGITSSRQLLQHIVMRLV
jgi:hypothetical protein